MSKNPFLICFETPASEYDVHLMRQLSDECHQLYPHAFLLYVHSSPSAFKKTFLEYFQEKNHFLCLVQKGQQITFHPFDTDPPVSG